MEKIFEFLGRCVIAPLSFFGLVYLFGWSSWITWLGAVVLLIWTVLPAVLSISEMQEDIYERLGGS